jgi:hypothetical protein
MEREKIIDMDVFKCSLHIIVTEDANDSVDSRGLRAYVGERPGVDMMKNCDGFVFQKEQSDYCVVLSPNIGLGVIAHESVHAVGRIFRDRGVIADYDNDEVFAYCVGWLSDIIAKEVEESCNSFCHEDGKEG